MEGWTDPSMGLDAVAKTKKSFPAPAEKQTSSHSAHNLVIILPELPHKYKTYISILTTSHLKLVVKPTPEAMCTSNISHTVDISNINDV
jgi:hypothetical protein